MYQSFVFNRYTWINRIGSKYDTLPKSFFCIRVYVGVFVCLVEVGFRGTEAEGDAWTLRRVYSAQTGFNGGGDVCVYFPEAELCVYVGGVCSCSLD